MPTKVIIIGANGRMGKTLINLVLDSDKYELAGAVELKANMRFLENLPCPVSDSLEDILRQTKGAVTIDFSSPLSSMDTARIAAKCETPLVIGSTGFDQRQFSELREMAKIVPLLWSANMSVGVNVLLHYLPLLAKALGDDYDIEIVETHHKHKKDAPSGTALMLGKALAKARGWNEEEALCFCRQGQTGERPEKQIGIMALRGGDVVGIHNCHFFGPGEIIEVSHTAETRENFAQGALRAASWLKDKTPGSLYSMQDVIQVHE